MTNQAHERSPRQQARQRGTKAKKAQPGRAAGRLASPTIGTGRGDKKRHKALVSGRPKPIVYRPKEGVDAYVRQLGQANPLQMIEVERAGVQGLFIKDLSARMGVPTARFFEVLGLPKATAERKAARREHVTGNGGRAAVAMARLLHQAQELVSDSTAEGVDNFDAAQWLGAWIERPQPALGGRRPAELLDTPTGFAIVSRLLGALQGGSYQ